MRPRRFLALNALLLLASGCADALLEVSPPSGDDTLVFMPAHAGVIPGGTQTLMNGNPAAYVWSVDGVVGGNDLVGRITAPGRYTAPASPSGDSVVVTASLIGQPDSVRRSVLFFLPDGFPDSYQMTLPRAVELAVPRPLRIIVRRPANVRRVDYVTRLNEVRPMFPLGFGAFTIVLPHAELIGGYRPGSLRSFTGFFDEFDAANVRLRRINFTVNFREAAHPDVSITPLGADAQRSAHLLNLRHDEVSVNATPSLVARAIARLGSSDFDFIAVIANVSTTNNRNYQSIRNDITGLGHSIFDFSSSWGTGPRVLGAISYPIDTYFDAAEKATLHEIGHRWINFGTHPALASGRPHWPMSTMAGGIMGFSMAGGVGGDFPIQRTDLGNGTARVTQLPLPAPAYFDPFDLYAMGLLPPDSVPPGMILPATTAFSALTTGAVFPVTPFTIDDYVTAHGPRVPSHATAPREFRVVTVILSPFRLLSPAEMAFFDVAAARGETEVSLPAQIGFSNADAPGFYTATGGRARLRMSLP